MRLDYGIAHIQVSTSTGYRRVTSAAEIIGVPSDQLARWREHAMLDGKTLTLDSARQYVYTLLGPSAHTPDVTRFKRDRKAHR